MSSITKRPVQLLRGDPKRDPNSENYPYVCLRERARSQHTAQVWLGLELRGGVDARNLHSARQQKRSGLGFRVAYINMNDGIGRQADEQTDKEVMVEEKTS